ncbi:MAG: hypothetical protein ABSA18_15760 [Dehalococcoidia bacterium]|jgi:hypothetical protein
MAKRKKKPIVKLEQRREWLRRHDAGESIPDIAKSEFYDVRTVRRHVEAGQQERERLNARVTVLKDALERHYRDLCNFAQKIEAEVMREEKITLREERLWKALRQHIPRSLLWQYLNKWDELLEKKADLQEEIRRKLERMIKSDAKLMKLAPDNDSIEPFMQAILKFQIDAWARGRQGLTLANNLSSEEAGKGLINLKYGAFSLNKITKDQVPVEKDLIMKYETKVKGWDENKTLSKVFIDLKHLQKEIGDEIAIITLRRVIPGKCLYCPL